MNYAMKILTRWFKRGIFSFQQPDDSIMSGKSVSRKKQKKSKKGINSIKLMVRCFFRYNNCSPFFSLSNNNLDCITGGNLVSDSLAKRNKLFVKMLHGVYL